MDRGDRGRVNAGFLGGLARGGFGGVAPAGSPRTEGPARGSAGGAQTGGRGGAGAGPGENPRGDRTAAGLDGFDQSESLNTATGRTDRPINLSARLAVGTSTAQVGSATATGVALVEINEVP